MKHVTCVLATLLLDVNEVPGSPCESFMIAENKPDDTIVATLNSTDPDNEAFQKQVLSYSVVNNVPFKVNSAGQLVKSGVRTTK